MVKQLTATEQAYIQGFIDKCAEYGVDPEALMKEAQRGAQIGKLLNRAAAKLEGPLLGAASMTKDLPQAVTVPQAVMGLNILKDPNIAKLIPYWLPRGGATQRLIAPSIRDLSKSIKAFKPSAATKPLLERLDKLPSGGAIRTAQRELFGGEPAVSRLAARLRATFKTDPSKNLDIATALADTPIGRAILAAKS